MMEGDQINKNKPESDAEKLFPSEEENEKLEWEILILKNFGSGFGADEPDYNDAIFLSQNSDFRLN